MFVIDIQNSVIVNLNQVSIETNFEVFVRFFHRSVNSRSTLRMRRIKKKEKDCSRWLIIHYGVKLLLSCQLRSHLGSHVGRCQEWHSSVLFFLRSELGVCISGFEVIGKITHCVFMNFGHRVINIAIPHSWRGGSAVQCSALKVRLWVKLRTPSRVFVDSLYNQLYPTAENIPKFYGLPKIHKNDAQLRPIVPSIGTVMYKTAKFLARY